MAAMAASGQDERGVVGEVCTEMEGKGWCWGGEVRWWSREEREGDRK